MTAGSAALGALADPERYQALPVQYGMVVNNLRYPDDGVDVLQITLDWAAPLQPQALEAGLAGRGAANPVLRTGFESDDVHGLVQVVGPARAAADLPLARAAPAGHRRGVRAVPAGRPARAVRPEPAAADPADRAGAAAAARTGDRAVLTFHHALLDGRSMRLLVEQLTLSYAARLAGRAAAQPPRPPFRDFVRWWQMADAVGVRGVLDGPAGRRRAAPVAARPTAAGPARRPGRADAQLRNWP